MLFSGQDSLPQLVGQASTWSLSALALLVTFKGLAWSVSLSAFRGGPTFPALFLGAAGGMMLPREWDPLLNKELAVFPPTVAAIPSVSRRAMPI